MHITAAGVPFHRVSGANESSPASHEANTPLLHFNKRRPPVSLSLSVTFSLVVVLLSLFPLFPSSPSSLLFLFLSPPSLLFPFLLSFLSLSPFAPASFLPPFPFSLLSPAGLFRSSAVALSHSPPLLSLLLSLSLSLSPSLPLSSPLVQRDLEATGVRSAPSRCRAQDSTAIV